jgi:cytochrome c553
MDYVGLGIVLLVALVFIVLAVWSWRARRMWVKLVAGIPTTLLALGALFVAYSAIAGFGRITRTYPNTATEVSVAMTPENIALGEKYARTCVGCHSSNGQLPLGGQPFFGGPEGGPPFGVLWAPNLTPVHLESWSDGEIIRAIREGIGKDGRSLLIMPSKAFHSMSDADVQALVAYLRSQPPVEPNSPPKALNLLAALTIASSDEAFSAQPPITGSVTAPPAGATPEYGDYLVTTVGCRECHGENLQGTVPPGSETGIASPNLVAFVGQVTEEQFLSTLRTGKTPDGRTLDPSEMPWQDLQSFTDDDLRAIYRFIQTLA